MFVGITATTRQGPVELCRGRNYSNAVHLHNIHDTVHSQFTNMSIHFSSVESKISQKKCLQMLHIAKSLTRVESSSHRDLLNTGPGSLYKNTLSDARRFNLNQQWLLLFTFSLPIVAGARLKKLSAIVNDWKNYTYNRIDGRLRMPGLIPQCYHSRDKQHTTHPPGGTKKVRSKKFNLNKGPGSL